VEIYSGSVGFIILIQNSFLYESDIHDVSQSILNELYTKDRQDLNNVVLISPS
jgi:hypothetical protein